MSKLALELRLESGYSYENKCRYSIAVSSLAICYIDNRPIKPPWHSNCSTSPGDVPLLYLETRSICPRASLRAGEPETRSLYRQASVVSEKHQKAILVCRRRCSTLKRMRFGKLTLTFCQDLCALWLERLLVDDLKRRHCRHNSPSLCLLCLIAVKMVGKPCAICMTPTNGSIRPSSTITKYRTTTFTRTGSDVSECTLISQDASTDEELPDSQRPLPSHQDRPID